MTGPQRDGLPILAFESGSDLEAWLAGNAGTSQGIWLRVFKVGSGKPTARFEELELGIAYGWSESKRVGYDSESYLQKFTPRKSKGTTSERNLRIARRLIEEGRMT
ncbi:MAG: hypothetical protein KDB69_00075, partial [Acidimicrobiia bacterium]|nr:hypothetical protein [Acidimicrobiia bacterium]